LFSGYVKAVDPLGTAYKMEQYFAEFESLFQGTWLDFIAPIFPFFSSISIGFSVFMIVFELALAAMLILGYKRKLTAWLFFLLVLFFTILTGFTYLTGYVPAEATFFEFSKWGEYVETNMKVTDCGCFGDFLVLKPKTSFLKDVFLLFPAILFLFAWKSKHQLFNKLTRGLIVGGIALVTLIYCLSNYSWDIPGQDFRPFKEEVNVMERKAAEEEAEINVPVTYILTNKATGETQTMPMDDYISRFKDFPKAEWDTDTERGEPTVPHTKISEFQFESTDGVEMTEEAMTKEGYQFMIVAYKLYEESTTTKELTKLDSIYTVDTVLIENETEPFIVKSLDTVITRKTQKVTAVYDVDYINNWTKTVNPILAAAEKDGVGAFALTSYIDHGKLDDFRHATQSAYPFYLADDILLKTIVRSNPGIVLLKDGTIVKKWHYKKLPSYDELKATYLK